MYRYFKIQSAASVNYTLFSTNDPVAVILLKSDSAMRHKKVIEITQAKYEELEAKLKESKEGVNNSDR